MNKILIILNGLALFFLVVENSYILRNIGLILIVLAILFNLFHKRELLEKSFFSNSFFVFILYFYLFLLTLSCSGQALNTALITLFKFLICFFYMFTVNRKIFISSLNLAASSHIVFFLIHLLFIILGLNNLYLDIFNSGAKTSFDVYFIENRPTGLFDEPSLFGMTILGLLLIKYFYTKEYPKQNFITLFSFSTPVMVTMVSNYFLSQFRNIKLGSLLLTASVLTIVFYFVFMLFLSREESLVFSPMLLRLSHLLYLSESSNLLVGNGLCNAYSFFPLDLDSEERLSMFLSNFKDAGQIIYIIDRVGLILFSFFIIFIFLKFSITFVAPFLIFLLFSKTIFLSPLVMLMFLTLPLSNRDIKSNES